MKFSLLALIALLSSCSSTGPVDTTQADSQFPVVGAPKEFSSPLDHLEQLWKEVEKIASHTPNNANLRGPVWKKYIDQLQTYGSAEAEQDATYDELEQTGKLELIPGKSYSLELESFCVWAGKARPTVGDGFKLAALSGKAKNWIPEILERLGRKNISQEDLQILIWALLEGLRFDELSNKNQHLLLEFYPDAATRFGNRQLEDLGKNILSQVLPSAISSTVDQVDDLRDTFLKYQEDSQGLAKIFAPLPDRATPIPVGWMKMPDYYIRVMSMDGYEHVRIDIYVPSASEREPNSMITFRPSQWIALPAEGQRLAISTKARRRHRSIALNPCERLKKYIAPNCHKLTEADREKLLNIADPAKFSQTRYQSPPRAGAKIEEATDCSNFVNEIYHRAGFTYPYADTKSFACLPLFEKVDPSQGKAGDLVLYQGHIGLLDKDGAVIGATVGGSVEHRSMRASDDPKFISSIKRYPISQAGDGAWQILRWHCP